eukprot:TRINITY_DN4393_c0_g1_i1.p1 TRINITY_DN4393_c0_g1~~TRINITY_DN4393_c0_g1_i1.p1  ORF type:complete len:73 (+),score=5.01 TRINITY_DN4393_c0_g1_i1:128-346(+)
MLSDVAKKLHQISVKLFDKCEKRNKIQQTNVKKSRHCCHIYEQCLGLVHFSIMLLLNVLLSASTRTRRQSKF